MSWKITKTIGSVDLITLECPVCHSKHIISAHIRFIDMIKKYPKCDKCNTNFQHSVSTSC